MFRFVSIALMCANVFAASTLPPSIEADRLAIQAKSAIKDKNYTLAYASLIELEKLGTPLPQTFYHFKGVAQNGIGKYNGAKTSLEKYLQITGTTGKYYTESLEAYNIAEQESKRILGEYNTAKSSYETAMQDYSQSLNDCRTRESETIDKLTARKEKMENADNVCTSDRANEFDMCQSYFNKIRAIERELDRIFEEETECDRMEKNKPQLSPPLPPTLD